MDLSEATVTLPAGTVEAMRNVLQAAKDGQLLPEALDAVIDRLNYALDNQPPSRGRTE